MSWMDRIYPPDDGPADSRGDLDRLVRRAKKSGYNPDDDPMDNWKKRFENPPSDLPELEGDDDE